MPSMLSWVNLADTAQQIAASAESPGLGVRSLLTESVTEVWRVPALADESSVNLDITLPAAATVGTIAVFAPRESMLAPSYDVRLYCSNVAIGDAEVLFVGRLPLNLHINRGAWWTHLAAPAAMRFIRLRFTSNSADEYLQLGRIWIGPDFRPAIGADVAGYVRGWIDSGTTERAAVSGVVAASRGATLRAPSFTLNFLDQAEADAIEDAAAASGTTRQLIANAATDRGAKDLVLGRFATLPAPALVDVDLFRAEIAMLEDR